MTNTTTNPTPQERAARVPIDFAISHEKVDRLRTAIEHEIVSAYYEVSATLNRRARDLIEIADAPDRTDLPEPEHCRFAARELSIVACTLRTAATMPSPNPAGRADASTASTTKATSEVAETRPAPSSSSSPRVEASAEFVKAAKALRDMLARNAYLSHVVDRFDAALLALPAEAMHPSLDDISGALDEQFARGYAKACEEIASECIGARSTGEHVPFSYSDGRDAGLRHAIHVADTRRKHAMRKLTSSPSDGTVAGTYAGVPIVVDRSVPPGMLRVGSSKPPPSEPTATTSDDDRPCMWPGCESPREPESFLCPHHRRKWVASFEPSAAPSVALTMEQYRELGAAAANLEQLNATLRPAWERLGKALEPAREMHGYVRPEDFAAAPSVEALSEERVRALIEERAYQSSRVLLQVANNLTNGQREMQGEIDALRGRVEALQDEVARTRSRTFGANARLDKLESAKPTEKLTVEGITERLRRIAFDAEASGGHDDAFRLWRASAALEGGVIETPALDELTSETAIDFDGMEIRDEMSVRDLQRAARKELDRLKVAPPPAAGGTRKTPSAAREERDAVIEECARVCDALVGEGESMTDSADMVWWDSRSSAKEGIEWCAERIRSLKSPPPARSTEEHPFCDDDEDCQRCHHVAALEERLTCFGCGQTATGRDENDEPLCATCREEQRQDEVRLIDPARIARNEAATRVLQDALGASPSPRSTEENKAETGAHQGQASGVPTSKDVEAVQRQGAVASESQDAVSERPKRRDETAGEGAPVSAPSQTQTVCRCGAPATTCWSTLDREHECWTCNECFPSAPGCETRKDDAR